MKTCPECKKSQLKTKTGMLETVYRTPNGEIRPLHVPNVTWLECDACGEVLLDDAAMNQIEEVRRQARGLLATKEIREFRTRQGKTQLEMAFFLGVGDKTYARWESGASIQTVAYDRYLRLLIMEPNNIGIVQSLADGLSSSGTGPTQEHGLTEIFPYIDIPSTVRRQREYIQAMFSGTLYSGPRVGSL